MRATLMYGAGEPGTLVVSPFLWSDGTCMFCLPMSSASVATRPSSASAS